ncbi:swr complex subunit [Recurvomyces mirabilis]|nr:swr complex subunit [Recurvomyces mirabilis]
MVPKQVGKEADDASDSEVYDENADEDFSPEKAAAEAEEGSSSSDDDEKAVATVVERTVKRAKKRKVDDVDDGLDSGDEATIAERKRGKKRKKDAPQEQPQDDDSGGEGGFIRTRAQRVVEKQERKDRKRARVGDVTIDVNAIWEELNNIPIGRVAEVQNVPVDGAGSEEHVAEQDKENTTTAQDEDLITITRRIRYAGEVTEVTERVPRASKEAQAYLKANPLPTDKDEDSTKPLLRRPLKRPSLFEPNPTATIKGVAPTHPLLRPRAPSRQDTLLLQQRLEEEAKKKAERMTTVQKSALDWKGFVQKEGIAEELRSYGRSKQGFLAREEFLGRADLVREERGREARLKGGGGG